MGIHCGAKQLGTVSKRKSRSRAGNQRAKVELEAALIRAGNNSNSKLHCRKNRRTSLCLAAVARSESFIRLRKSPMTSCARSEDGFVVADGPELKTSFHALTREHARHHPRATRNDTFYVDNVPGASRSRPRTRRDAGGTHRSCARNFFRANPRDAKQPPPSASSRPPRLSPR